ncbi:MAG: ferritin family protein [Candidatus Diapherotrites archaeon]|uniref:Ferritin family protein n=1 Tax=Candidatus Iainarchaeum sp. TaxID=3101447 RepID=A0A939C9W9_9ARCH|nr:ferritin family protein [Candidatus Diapherotrites archaeon]
MAETIGAKELKQALEKVSSNDLNQVAEGIAIAAGIESEGIAFYEKQAALFEGETKSFFTFLAGQEKEHLQAINELKNTLEKTGQWVEIMLPELKKPKIFSKKDWDKGNKDGLTAVLFALWKEKQAREFYEGVAKAIQDEGAKQFFLALAEFEKMHAALLEEYVEDSYYTHELIMG